MKRFWPALLLSLAVGAAGGLLYTWILDPVQSYVTTPDALRMQDKLVYALMIGDLYAFEGDLARAEARLAGLGLEPDGPALAGLIEQFLADGGQPEDARNLARLAEALGASGGVVAVFAGPTQLPQPSPSAETTVAPQASPTPLPTLTPAPSFRLAEQTAVCADPGQPGLISVWVQDATGVELPGVEVVVAWSGGQDRFFTGLQPGLGAGYADFQMVSGVEYEVSLASYRGDVAQRLAAAVSPGVCPAGVTAVNWRLIFQRAP